MRDATLRQLALMGGVMVASACGSGLPEGPDPEAVVIGTVAIDGETPRRGEAVVITFIPNGTNIVTGVEDGGQYRIEATEFDRICESFSLAWADNGDFPLVTDLRRAVPTRPNPCVGELTGPDFDLPARDAPVVTARVSGTVTVGGTPTATTVILQINHPVWQSDPLDETVSGSDGTFALEAELPLHLCPVLNVRALDEITGVPFCGDATVDVVR